MKYSLAFLVVASTAILVASQPSKQVTSLRNSLNTIAGEITALNRLAQDSATLSRNSEPYVKLPRNPEQFAAQSRARLSLTAHNTAKRLRVSLSLAAQDTIADELTEQDREQLLDLSKQLAIITFNCDENFKSALIHTGLYEENDPQKTIRNINGATLESLSAAFKHPYQNN